MGAALVLVLVTACGGDTSNEADPSSTPEVVELDDVGERTQPDTMGATDTDVGHVPDVPTDDLDIGTFDLPDSADPVDGDMAPLDALDVPSADVATDRSPITDAVTDFRRDPDTDPTTDRFDRSGDGPPTVPDLNDGGGMPDVTDLGSPDVPESSWIDFGALVVDASTGTGALEILVMNLEELSGFQFDVVGVNGVGSPAASGGRTEAFSPTFPPSTSNPPPGDRLRVLWFAFPDNIPKGEGVLTVLSIVPVSEATQICFEGVILVTPEVGELDPLEIGDCIPVMPL